MAANENVVNVAVTAMQTSGASLTSPSIALSLAQGDPVTAAVTAASFLESFAALAGKSPAMLPISLSALALANDLRKFSDQGYLDDGNFYGTLADFTAGITALGAVTGAAPALISAGVLATIAAGIASMLQPQYETEDWQAIRETVSDLWDGASTIVDESIVTLNEFFESVGETVQKGISNFVDGLTEFGSFLWDIGWELYPDEAGKLAEISDLVFPYFEAAGSALKNLKDPLALDLNHDGYISTISADEGITFDHGATGVEYGTGWIDSGDAWLALDLNGNGVIDSGRELFGDNTIKLDGNRATDAFDALMSFDSNGDGKVDAADASGDVDLDGILEAGETFWDINRNGVFDADDKTFVDFRLWKDANSDGIADSYDTAQFNLTENRFFREFDSSLTVSSTAAALPNMKGSGVVRDLREVA